MYENVEPRESHGVKRLMGTGLELRRVRWPCRLIRRCPMKPTRKLSTRKIVVQTLRACDGLTVQTLPDPNHAEELELDILRVGMED